MVDSQECFQSQQQSNDTLYQVYGCTTSPIDVHPLQDKGKPQASRDLVHYRLASSVSFDRVIVCHFVVTGDRGGSSIKLPGLTVTLLFSTREHTEWPQLVSPVISPVSHDLDCL